MPHLAPGARSRIEDIAKLYQYSGALAEYQAMLRILGQAVEKCEHSTVEPHSRPPAVQPEWCPAIRKHLLGTLLFSTYIFIIGLMLFPHWPPRDLLIKPVQPFLGAFGLWQSWNVFSPEIRKENFHVTASITMKDGSVLLWEFPRPDRLSGIEKMRAQRFRKWVNDRVKNNTFGNVLPDAARYVARLHRDDANPPIAIALFSHSAPIEPPKPDVDTAAPPHWQQRLLYTYKVKPEDLK